MSYNYIHPPSTNNLRLSSKKHKISLILQELYKEEAFPSKIIKSLLPRRPPSPKKASRPPTSMLPPSSSLRPPSSSIPPPSSLLPPSSIPISFSVSSSSPLHQPSIPPYSIPPLPSSSSSNPPPPSSPSDLFRMPRTSSYLSNSDFSISVERAEIGEIYEKYGKFDGVNNPDSKLPSQILKSAIERKICLDSNFSRFLKKKQQEFLCFRKEQNFLEIQRKIEKGELNLRLKPDVPFSNKKVKNRRIFEMKEGSGAEIREGGQGRNHEEREVEGLKGEKARERGDSEGEKTRRGNEQEKGWGRKEHQEKGVKMERRVEGYGGEKGIMKEERGEEKGKREEEGEGKRNREGKEREVGRKREGKEGGEGGRRREEEGGEGRRERERFENTDTFVDIYREIWGRKKNTSRNLSAKMENNFVLDLIIKNDSNSKREVSPRRIFRERPSDKYVEEKNNLISKIESLKPKHKKYASLTNIQKLKQKYMSINYGAAQIANDQKDSSEFSKHKQSNRVKTPSLTRPPPAEYDTLASASKKKSFCKRDNVPVSCDTCEKYWQSKNDKKDFSDDERIESFYKQLWFIQKKELSSKLIQKMKQGFSLFEDELIGYGRKLNEENFLGLT